MAREFHDRTLAIVLSSLDRVERHIMALEIKGLGNVVADAKKQIARLRAESAGLNSDISDMIQSVQDVRKQVNAAHDDLKFEAATLGNMPPEEDSSVSPPVSPPSFRDGAAT